MTHPVRVISDLPVNRADPSARCCWSIQRDADHARNAIEVDVAGK